MKFMYLACLSLVTSCFEHRGYVQNDRITKVQGSTPVVNNEEVKRSEISRESTKRISVDLKNIDQLCSYNTNDNVIGIVGGKEVSMIDLVAKSTVLLSLGETFCTGTIIGPNHIVTAAHCMAPVLPSTEIGLYWGSTPSMDDKTEISSWSIHPQYADLPEDDNGYLYETLYDVAVVSFSGQIPQGFGISPIGSTQDLEDGTPVILAGYGATSENDETSPVVLRSLAKPARFDRKVKEVQLDIGGGGACYGDSGGPSYILDKERSACLRVLSSTTGPARGENNSCDLGSGTLMDITLYQSWMKCAFKKMGTPLAYLKDNDGSQVDCLMTDIIEKKQ